MRKRKRAGDPGHESARAARHAPPTDALPGSPAKIDVLSERYARRQALFCPGDLEDAEGLRLNFVRAGNHAFVLDAGSPVLDEREKNPTKKLRNRISPDPGDRIRQARRALGWTQQRLSRASGISQETISRLEARGLHPNLSTIHRLSRALGCCPDWVACLPL